MSYGIQIDSGNGNVQINSNTNGKGLIVIDSGTASSLPTLVNLDEVFVFARPTATVGQNYLAIDRGTPNANGEQTIDFKRSDGTSLNVDYIISKVSNAQTAASSGYGVQVFNIDGDLAFDSGLFTGDGGFGITDFLQSRAGSGQYDLITTADRNYALINSTNHELESNVGLNLFFVFVSTTNSSYSQKGIYFAGRFQFGNPIQYQAIPNLGAILIAEVGSV